MEQIWGNWWKNRSNHLSPLQTNVLIFHIWSLFSIFWCVAKNWSNFLLSFNNFSKNFNQILSFLFLNCWTNFEAFLFDFNFAIRIKFDRFDLSLLLINVFRNLEWMLRWVWSVVLDSLYFCCEIHIALLAVYWLLFYHFKFKLYNYKLNN